MKIERLLSQNLQNNLFLGKVIVLYGPRQVGKTTLIKQLQQKLGQSSLYLNCEEPQVNKAFTAKSSQEMKNFIGEVEVLFLDEAQTVRNIGRSLKVLHDAYPELQIVATGSSSFDLANQINEPLTGRKLEFMLFPLSVGEVLPDKRQYDFQTNLPRFLRYGLYPEVFTASSPNRAKQFLQELTTSYLFKDILEFQQVKGSDILLKLLQALAYQLGQEVAYTELANLLNLDQETVQRYIDLLEKAFVIFRLNPLSRNLRKELGKKRKIYFYDLGLRNGLVQNFNDLDLRPDAGAVWENFCILERKKVLSYREVYANTYFWRTYDQKEIDYIEERDGSYKAFEFKLKKNKVKKPQEFLENYSNSSFEVVSPENFLEFLNIPIYNHQT